MSVDSNGLIDPEEDDIDVFDNATYIGMKVSFPDGSTWKLQSKLRHISHEVCQAECEGSGARSEARAVFLCCKVSGTGPPAAMIKIRLQIPWYKTAGELPDARAKQAISETPSVFDSEIEALATLTSRGCSSIPSLLSWKKERQSINEGVPGGYKLSILMQRVPGIDLDPGHPVYLVQMSREERELLRKAFKAAWLETVRCGIVNVTHVDESIGNILWDKEDQKCHLIDWECWRLSDGRTTWEDRLWDRWNVLQMRGSWSHFEVSQWRL
ncbi:uncharacterized protein BP01DRAFT_306816 [Aspergillus saccharolyticus JOP 1030-1]|uniref:Aminoglycoside phosphotransferase domain-containing protein n=1 Tax=Aspergillus saccharolyticus JOP 1030-1 TaxID=1450539 RepID=A0A318Z256_9EURO|nr:hypothetical protein BP01DRAFT_306816 [Aspergillus saccharolyticus JOP 1030-1]PYH41019.1 hypothetical protein BP01DRAFT_306816 [Aspergillus saccharolyticus JOP 1030-1]